MSFYDGTATEAEREWARSKTQFRLTLLDSINTCLQGEDVGEGLVDLELGFDNHGKSSTLFGVTTFEHDNPSSPELNAAGQERVLGCIRDNLVNRDFEMAYSMDVAPRSAHRIAIRVPISRDPIYEFLKGGNWDE